MTLIHQKILAIQQAVPILKKEGELELGGKKLKTLTIDTILENIRDLFNENQVIVLPTLVDHDSHIKYGQEPPSEVEPAKWSGRIPTKSIRELVIYDFTLVAVEDGSSVTVRVQAEAMDNQDKSSNKAFTAAYKSMLVKTFMLVTGDPDDIDTQNPPEDPEHKADRGEQHRTTARAAASKPKANTTTATRPTQPAPAEPAEAAVESRGADSAPEVTEPKIERQGTQSSLDEAKARLRAANREYGELTGSVNERDEPGMTIAEVNEIGMAEVSKTRDKWITSMRDINKIAKAIETKSADIRKAREGGDPE